MGKLTFKIKASSLIEVIVAMIIISTVFLLSLAVFLNIAKNSNNSLKIKAAMVSEDVLSRTRMNKLFLDEDIALDNLDIVKTVNQYKNYKDLVLVVVNIKNKQGKSLILKKEIMIRENKN